MARSSRGMASQNGDEYTPTFPAKSLPRTCRQYVFPGDPVNVAKTFVVLVRKADHALNAVASNPIDCCWTSQDSTPVPASEAVHDTVRLVASEYRGRPIIRAFD